MNRYLVKYVTLKDNLWAQTHETYIDAENMNQLIAELDREAGTNVTWYLLEIWEKQNDEYGSYALCVPDKLEVSR